MSLFYFFCVNIGKNMKIPIMDIIKPPIVSAANGNQKASFPVPTMNGMNLLHQLSSNIGIASPYPPCR